jgi:hypothetical protein
VTARDLPRKEGRPRGGWNRDYAWFTAEEAAAMVPEGESMGRFRNWPAAAARRFAQCHLVDFVNGQTTPFRAAEVDVEIRSIVVGAKDGKVALTIQGRSRADAPDRGVDLELSGTARFDRGAGRFTAFEMIAKGTRRGGTRYNVRDGDPGPSPVGFHLVLAAPDERIAPGLYWAYEW